LIASGSEQSAAIFIRSTSTSHTVDLQATTTQNGCGDQLNWFKLEDQELWWNDVAESTSEINCQYADSGLELDAGSLSVSDIAVASIPGETVGSQVPCDYTPSKARDLGVVNTRHMIINVPTEA
jgi:hypothetical protein